jgi:hypothetical protein
MITLYIDETIYICEYNDKKYINKDLSSLARALMNDGCEEQNWIALDLSTLQRRLFGKSIKWIADHKLVENSTGFRWIKYEPMSDEARMKLRGNNG